MPSPRSIGRGCGSSASCGKGGETESGLGAISKIFQVEIAAEDPQQGFAVDFIEPRYPSDYRDGAELRDRTLVLFVAIADHHYALDGHFCTTQGPHREQSVIDRAQRRSCSNNNRKS